MKHIIPEPILVQQTIIANNIQEALQQLHPLIDTRIHEGIVAIRVFDINNRRTTLK